MNRREFVLMSTFVAFGCKAPPVLEAQARRLTHAQEGEAMYGTIGRIIAVEGAREELASVLLEGIPGMPGCLSYVVALDSEDPNGLWVTEVWESQANHEASLSLPAVQEAIQKGRPLISRFGEQFITTPLGGVGLGGG